MTVLYLYTEKHHLPLPSPPPENRQCRLRCLRPYRPGPETIPSRAQKNAAVDRGRDDRKYIVFPTLCTVILVYANARLAISLSNGIETAFFGPKCRNDTPREDLEAAKPARLAGCKNRFFSTATPHARLIQITTTLNRTHTERQNTETECWKVYINIRI